jgi:hypothetical protein
MKVQSPKSKFQAPTPRAWKILEVRDWNLVGIWNSEFGVFQT